MSALSQLCSEAQTLLNSAADTPVACATGKALAMTASGKPSFMAAMNGAGTGLPAYSGAICAFCSAVAHSAGVSPADHRMTAGNDAQR